VTTGGDFAIDVRGLRKSYGGREVVRGIDLRIPRGEVYALLGPNGAGKTTTVEILEGHRQRDAGEVSVVGFDPAHKSIALKQHIGIVLQKTSVDPYLTVEETVEMYRGYFPNPRPVDEVLHLVGLAEQRAQRARRLSGGQQRRLDVAIGICGDPELLFLDEPTTGFDPAARREAWEMVRGLQSLGKTILLTTHYMDEAEHLAGRVGIMKQGTIIAEGPPHLLINRDSTATVRFALPDGGAALLDGLEGFTRSEDGFYASITSTPTDLLYELTGRARAYGMELRELTVTRPTLEDTYLRLVEQEP
jgi:ABC-2 type transport system ATP-binding protein